MRQSFSSFVRLLAGLLVLSVLSYGMAMAAYACPQLAPAAAMVMDGAPCAEMDKQEPVLCAEHQSGLQLALEHLPAAPPLGPMTVTSVRPAPLPAAPPVPAAARGAAPPEPGTDPPYLRTRRLRI
jgi:hypothetical protein